MVVEDGDEDKEATNRIVAVMMATPIVMMRRALQLCSHSDSATKPKPEEVSERAKRSGVQFGGRTKAGREREREGDSKFEFRSGRCTDDDGGEGREENGIESRHKGKRDREDPSMHEAELGYTDEARTGQTLKRRLFATSPRLSILTRAAYEPGKEKGEDKREESGRIKGNLQANSRFWP